MSKEDPEKVRARVARWQRENRERYNEYMREYRKRPEAKKKIKEYKSTEEFKARKKEENRLYQQKLRARKKT